MDDSTPLVLKQFETEATLLCAKYPGLQVVWHTICNGVKERDQALKKASTELLRVQHSYFTTSIVVNEVKDLLTELISNSCPESEELKRVERALLSQQLRKHLKLDNDLGNDEEVVLGAENAVLGVSGSDLRNIYALDDGDTQAVQRMKTGVEQRLVQKWDSFAKFVMSTLPEDQQQRDVVEVVCQFQDEQIFARSSCLEQVVALHAALGKYLKCLIQLFSELATFTRNQKLGHAAQDIQARVSNDRSYANAMQRKVEHLEAVVLHKTYGAADIEALKVVQSELASLLKETTISLKQEFAQLKTFEELGPEFEAIVQGYKKIQEDLAAVNQQLATFQQLEQDLMQGSRPADEFL